MAKKERLIEPFNCLMLIIAGFINAVGVILFLNPVGVIDGGISGLSIFISTVAPKVHIAILLVCINLPLFLLGIKILKVKFIIYSIISIISYTVWTVLFKNVFFIENVLIKNIENDILLGTIFGGLFSGIGSGLTIRYGGAIDGIEVVGICFAKRIGLSIGQFVMVFNIILYVIASIVLNKLKVGFYSIISYAIGLKVVDFIVEGFDKAKGCTIITTKKEEVASAISEELRRGVTVLDCVGYYSKESKTMLYCVVNRFEVVRLKEIVATADPQAFLAINDISEVVGAKRYKYALKDKKITLETVDVKISEQSQETKVESNTETK